MGEGVQPYIRRALDLPSGDIEAVIAEGVRGDRRGGARASSTTSTSAGGPRGGLERAGLIRDWLELPPAERVARRSRRSTASGPRPTATCARSARGRRRRTPITRRPRPSSTTNARRCSRCARAPLTPICSPQGLVVGRDYAEAYRSAKRRAGRGRFRRSDPRDGRSARPARAWANGCATSSTRRPTMS